MLRNFNNSSHAYADLPMNTNEPMKKILVVEDSPEVWFLINRFLGSKFDMVHCPTLGEAQEKLQHSSFDLIILDIILPDGDGMKFCAQLAEKGVTEQTPVILLTAKGAVPERVQGLTSGADDYIPKPFDPRELLARVDAVLRRRDTSKTSSEIRVGNLVVDLVRQKAYAGPNDEAVDLTPIEFRILAQLLQAKGGIIMREDLFKGVWGGNIFVSQRNIDTHICKLRHKIANYGVRIISKRGHGYRIELDQPAQVPMAQRNTGTDLPLGAM